VERPPPPAARSFPRSPCSDRNAGTRPGRPSPGGVRRHPQGRRTARPRPADEARPGRRADDAGQPGRRAWNHDNHDPPHRPAAVPAPDRSRRSALRSRDDLRLVPVSPPFTGPGEARPWHVSLVAATRRGRPGQRGIRLRPVAAPAKVRPRLRSAVAARAARKACRPASRPDGVRSIPQTVRVLSPSRRPAACRAVLLLLLARRPPGHRRPGPELHGQRLGRSDIPRRHGLSLP
jgi:hypothetical protein